MKSSENLKLRQVNCGFIVACLCGVSSIPSEVGSMSISSVASLMAAVAIFLLCSCSAANAPTPPAAAPAAADQVHANLLQLMRGVFFPNANVIFAAQSVDPAQVRPAADPALATDPLASVYGSWAAVENSALALAEAANLLTIPGRNCANGRPAPMTNSDWIGFVQGMRDAGMTAYRAGQSKNQDMILEASDAITTACSNCHDVYREKPGGDADRCM
jgi:hypothetical protein